MSDVIERFIEVVRGGFFVVGVEAHVNSPFTADLLRIDVQAGGYSCAHFSLTGLAFRLADVRAPRRAIGPLLRAFESLGESYGGLGYIDSPVSEQRLDDLNYTSGEAIDVEPINRVLADYVSVPPLESGYEAFVRGPINQPDTWFRDWPGWNPNPERQTGWSDETLEQLITATAESKRPLEIFLLWENSD